MAAAEGSLGPHIHGHDKAVLDYALMSERRSPWEMRDRASIAQADECPRFQWPLAIWAVVSEPNGGFSRIEPLLAIGGQKFDNRCGSYHSNSLLRPCPRSVRSDRPLPPQRSP